MTSFISVPDNLKDKPLRVVSNQYISDDTDYQRKMLEEKIEALKYALVQLDCTLNLLSSTTGSYIAGNVVSIDKNVVELSGVDSATQLVVNGYEDAESEERHWADGTVTKEKRTIIAYDEDAEYDKKFIYEFSEGQELFDVFSVKKISRTLIDDVIVTIVTFTNDVELKIVGLDKADYAGPFTMFDGISTYLVNCASWIQTNENFTEDDETFSDNTIKTSKTLLSMSTYDNDSNMTAWALLYLDNGKLVFWKRMKTN